MQSTIVYHTETVMLAARSGYRPGLLMGLGVGFSVAYLALSVVVAVLLMRRSSAVGMPAWMGDASVTRVVGRWRLRLPQGLGRLRPWRSGRGGSKTGGMGTTEKERMGREARVHGGSSPGDLLEMPRS